MNTESCWWFTMDSGLKMWECNLFTGLLELIIPIWRQTLGGVSQWTLDSKGGGCNMFTGILYHTHVNTKSWWWFSVNYGLKGWGCNIFFGILSIDHTMWIPNLAGDSHWTLDSRDGHVTYSLVFSMRRTKRRKCEVPTISSGWLNHTHTRVYSRPANSQRTTDCIETGMWDTHNCTRG